MTQLQLCPLGHEWQAPAETPGVCPTCGAAPESLDTLEGASSLPESAVADDLPPLPKPLPALDAHVPTPPPSSLEPTHLSGPAIASTQITWPSVANFEILGVLGRGGMGVVYKARHIPLKRLVALKMILAAEHANPEELSRFRAEAEAVAQLQHPNIVQIHEVGEQAGRPFLALEYVDGGNLAERLAGNPQPPDDSARLLATLARAVHFAHGKGILHRDLKPGNILLQAADAESGRRGDKEKGRQEDLQSPGLRVSPSPGLPVSVSPRLSLSASAPKITDFGLAKHLHADGQHTQTGAVMGTPCYMAPEQAEGRVRELGPACDIYALGSILYELLTGRPPFKGAHPGDTLQQLLTDEPVPPGRLQPKVPRDLETICLKCLHKEPARRYGSAAELADDLDRFLTNQPILARPTSLWERGLKWARRKPAAAALIAVSALGVIAVLVTTLIYSGKLTEENDRYLKQRDAAIAAEGDAKRHQEKAQKNLRKALGAVDRLLSRVGEMQLAYVPYMEEQRRKILEDALQFCLEFLEEYRDDPLTRQEAARAYARMGNIQFTLGRQQEAEDSYRRGLKLNDELAAQFPDDFDARHHQTLAHVDLGNLFLSQSRLDATRDEYSRGLGLAEELAKRFPQRTESIADQGKCLYGLAELEHLANRLTASAERYRQALACWEQLSRAQPNVLVWQHYRAKTVNQQGMLFFSLGQINDAERAFADNLELLERLVKDNPKAKELVNEHAESYRSLANAYMVMDRYEDAAPLCEKHLAIRRRQVLEHPGLPEHEVDLASALNNMGTVHVNLRQYAKAEACYREVLALRTKLVAAHPQIQELQAQLAGLHKNFAQLYRATARDNLAEKAMLEAIGIEERLIEKGLPARRVAISLGSSYLNMGLLVAQHGDTDQALKWYGKGDELLTKVLAEERRNAEVRQGLIDILKSRAYRLTMLEKNREAMPDWDRLVDLATGGERMSFRVYRLRTLARLGDWKATLAEADVMAKDAALPAENYYDMACVFARAAEDESGTARAEALGRRGVEFLEKAQAADRLRPLRQQLRNDRDLRAPALRGDFQALLKQVMEK